MKFSMMDSLECPEDGSKLKLWILKIDKTHSYTKIEKQQPVCTSSCAYGDIEPINMQKCYDCYSMDIEVGLLQCELNAVHIYPIVNGIPRMLLNALKQFNNYISQYFDSLPTELNNNINFYLAQNNFKHEKEFTHIQQSFSSEWDEINESDRAWGRSIEARRELFFHGVNLSSEDLAGKKILDAGCGHGEVEVSLLDTDAEIFAIDISSSLDDLQNRIRSLSNKVTTVVHFIQGNVHKLPFRIKCFDIVYSAGVLHHTHDTFQGLKSISKTLKCGGICYIEVYSSDHKNLIEKIRKNLTDLVRKITIRLPHRMLHILCYILAPIHWLYVNSYNYISAKRRYTKRTIRETELSLFDGFSPLYDWHYSTDEVKSWFNILGYDNIKKTYYNQNGIGILGRLKEPAKDTK